MSAADMCEYQPDRKYRMLRLRAGDWLCPSNDLMVLWRFHTYTDGRSQGLDVDYEVRTFWRAIYMPMPEGHHIDGDALPDPWDEKAWSEADWYLATRDECIRLMLKTDAQRERDADGSDS